MNYSDKLAFMPLRYLMPLVSISIVIATSIFSYIYVKEQLNSGVKIDISKHISERFAYMNSALVYALKTQMQESDLKEVLNVFEFKDTPGSIMGYINKDGDEVLISGEDQQKNLKYFLSQDFKDSKAFMTRVKAELCDVHKSEYLIWASDDIFYLFRPLLDGCNGSLQFLRFSIKHERQAHIDEMLNIIFFYTVVLLMAMFIVGSFSYSVISYRLAKLLTLISGYAQGVSSKQEVLGGRDEISDISRAFVGMSHKLTAVLDDMYTFVAVLNPKGEILFTNNTPLQASELEFSDVQGIKLSDTYWWEYDANTHLEIQSLIQRCINGEIINEETQIQIAQGKLIWITFSMHPVYNANGEIEHLVAEGVDISKQKQAYEELLHQSRKAQMGEMISVIAHQWRQPLAIISATSCKVILDNELDLIDSKELSRSMHKINHTVEHLGSTMKQFSNFFNPNKKTKETTFNEIVSKSISIIGSKLESEGVTIELDLGEEYLIQSFEEELIQVVMDMMKNSADFFKINTIHNAKITLKQYLQDEHVCLVIEDNAGGIRDEDMQELFNPYFSTKPHEGGTGLGLHMSKMIVQDHCNGEIRVQQLEGGARFIICLPLN